MRIFFIRAAVLSILLFALVSTTTAGDYQPIQDCQKQSDIELTACRNKIEENKALTPGQKQMLDMQINRFMFIQSILSQAKQEKIIKVNPSAPAEETNSCTQCQCNPEQSD
jgi:hypothetical protein